LRQLDTTKEVTLYSNDL